MMILKEAVLTVLLTGSTHYVDIGQHEDAVIYYQDATRAHMVLPGKPAMSGQWSLLADGYSVSWNDGPQGKWQIRYEPGVLTYLDGDGEARGVVTRIVPGNPENLSE